MRICLNTISATGFLIMGRMASGSAQVWALDLGDDLPSSFLRLHTFAQTLFLWTLDLLEYYLTEVGKVSTKSNGVARYRFCQVIRAIALISENVSYEPRAITIISNNRFLKPGAITFLRSVEELSDNSKM